MNPPRNAGCEWCNRTRDQVAGMMRINKGGMPTYLCFECVDDLKELADAHRRAWAARDEKIVIFPGAEAGDAVS